MDCDFFSTTKMARRSRLIRSQKNQQKIEKAQLDFSYLPNCDAANEYAQEFLNDGRVVIISFSPHNFAMAASDLTFANDIEAVMFVDMQLQHPEIWICAEDERALNDLFDAHLQVFLLSCAAHNVSVHLRSHIDYSFFIEYFIECGVLE